MTRLLMLLNSLSGLVMALMVLGTMDVLSLSSSSQHDLTRRQDPNAPPPATREQQDAVVALASTDPVGAARMAITLPYISGPGSVFTGFLASYAYVQGDEVQQLPWNTASPLATVPAVNGSDDGGWQTLPELDGFTLNRTFAIRGNATVPFYISTGYDAPSIRRAVIVMPGKPRDCWKYTSLVRSALNIIAMQNQPGANNASVLIMGICWMNQNDKAAGAVGPNELYWRSSGWSAGSHSVGPPVPLSQEEHAIALRKLAKSMNQRADSASPGADEGLHKRQDAKYIAHSDEQTPTDENVDTPTQMQTQNLTLPPGQDQTNISSYEVIDTLLDWLFDKSVFPSLNRVVVAGHSMGAQQVQRYAMLKKAKAYDPNVMFWIGNPGSYVFPTDDRENVNATCERATSWPYGLSNVTSIPKYARRDVNASLPAVIKRYRTRDIHYAYGLLDNGQGDTHCQSTLQGWNHLDRGCHFIFALANTSDSGEYRMGPNVGFPFAKQTVDFVANTSHQDYPMLSTNVSLWRLFNDRFDTADPPLANTTNPGDPTPHVRPKKSPKDGLKTKGEKGFVTPRSRIMAQGMLYGTVGAVVALYTSLYLFCRAGLGEKEEEWRRQLDAATTSRSFTDNPIASASTGGVVGGEGLRKRNGATSPATNYTRPALIGGGGGGGVDDSSYAFDSLSSSHRVESSVSSQAPFLSLQHEGLSPHSPRISRELTRHKHTASTSTDTLLHYPAVSPLFARPSSGPHPSTSTHSWSDEVTTKLR